MALFLTPLLLLALHAFEGHEHGVCSSKIETHLHEKDLDCSLHLLKQSNTLLTAISYSIRIKTAEFTNPLQEYTFLKNHYPLTFSLRGPPAVV
ncbi:hypothetical protein [uncultured Polaribacter sp.]|uniref:hypothetical protein n=1 Tax=uncultured Polaribacter sp. TaxID=174711 RepID=UPI00262D02EE|nr:hypothetical protein [uncultured Polaribacter sp.]